MVKDDPVRLQQMRRYLQNLPCTPTRESLAYITKDHMKMVASGKARGRDFVSRQGAVHIDITRYTCLPDGEQDRPGEEADNGDGRPNPARVRDLADTIW